MVQTILIHWRSVLLILSSSLALSPTFLKLVGVWCNVDDYSHGFIVVPVVLYLVWQKYDELKENLQNCGFIGLIAVFVALLLVFLGRLTGFRSLEYVSFIFVIIFSVWYLFGFAVLKKISWELGFLFFMVPMPSSIYARVTLPLQLITTELTTRLLLLLSIPVYREGNLIHLINTSLEIVNACSGLRSLLTILALAYIVGIISAEKVFVRVILLLSGVIIAMIVNVIRVSVIAVSAYHGFGGLTKGAPHMLLGLFLFAISLLFLIMVQKVLKWIFPGK
jgi:exosortase